MRILLSLLLSVQYLHASVIFQAPGSPGLDYRAALKADPDAQTPTQAYLASHPTAENKTRLLNLFAEAQRSFLENSKEEAKAKFTNLVLLTSEDDWNREAREIFLHAYFRLAQLEVDGQQQTRYLTQALLLGEDLHLPADLFPPPLTRRLLHLRNEIPRQQISPNFFQDGWTAILINGSICSRQNCPALPQLNGEVRVTFLSDQWVNFSSSVKLMEINSFGLKRVPWLTGDCERTNFSPEAESFPQKKSFWSLTCGQPISPVKNPPINFQPVASVPDAIPRIEVKAPANSFYKSGWFWAGVGAVALTVLVASAKKSNEKEPTTTYGY